MRGGVIFLIFAAVILFGAGISTADESDYSFYSNSDSLYRTGRYTYILDSLSDQTDQEILLKAKTYTLLGDRVQALHYLMMLEDDNLQAAAIYNRCGDFSEAREISESYKSDSGFAGLTANYLIAVSGDGDDSLGLESCRDIVDSPVNVISSKAALRLVGFYLDNGLPDSAGAYLELVEPEALGPDDLSVFHYYSSQLLNSNQQFQLALDNLEKSLNSWSLTVLTGDISDFVFDSLSPNLDSDQILELAGFLKRKRLFDEAIQLMDRLETSDSLGLVKAWCYFGKKEYSKAAGIFQELEKSEGKDIKAEAIYGRAACDYRRGRRLSGVEGLLAFADTYPENSLAPRALFTAGDFYQKSDPLKAAELLKRIVDNYQESSFYPRSLYLLGETYLKLNLKQKAREVYANYNIVNDQADLFDFWLYKISSPDTALLEKVIKRDNPTYYHFKARQQLGLDAIDSTYDFDDFIDDFFDKVEKYLTAQMRAIKIDKRRISFVDSLYNMGLETEAGRQLLYLHSKSNNLLYDLTLLQKSRELNLDWAFFEILDDFKSGLLNSGYSFDRETWLRLNYPVLFDDIIGYHARNDLDPYLALAVIRRESRFDPIAVSSVGAMGLMQLMPATASQMADTRSIPDNWMFEPGYNIKLGCKYLRWLYARLHKDEVVIAAYNAGPTAAKRWVKQAGSDPDTFIETIGYDQSRDYARWVIGDYYWYRYLWPNHFAH
jgi:hypothetical protein